MRRLSGWDASLLYGETPNVHMHTLKIAVFDPSDIGGLTVERFRQTLRRRLHLLPPLQYKLIDIPMQFHHPMWLEKYPIDLEHHVRHRQVAQPGGRRELDDLIGKIASTPLDRDRPLWEFVFVDGLAGGRIAVVGKVHHALADGVASGNLLARATEQSDNSPTEEDPDASDPLPTRAELLREAAVDHGDQMRQFPALIRNTVRGIRRMRKGSSARPENMATPLDPPDTFMNHVISPGREFATTSMVLADIREISKTLGLTINDIVLGLTAGTLRRALLVHDGAADDPLIVSVPVSLDTSPERVSGNRLSSLFVSLPVDVDDPRERCRLAREATVAAKRAHELIGPELMNDWADYLPPTLARRGFAVMARRAGKSRLMNLPVSNVRGPQQQRFVARAPITELYSVGPLTAGCGVNITVWSYVDQLNVSVIADSETVGDLHELVGWFHDELALLRAATGLPGPSEPPSTILPNVVV